MKKSLHIPTSEVTNRLFGHYAYDLGQDMATEILPGIINASSLEKIIRMNRVAESAADIIMSRFTRDLVALSREAGSILVRDEDADSLAASIQRTCEAASNKGVGEPQHVVEMMALNSFLDRGGFSEVHDTDMQESYDRVRSAFPAYGDMAVAS